MPKHVLQLGGYGDVSVYEGGVAISAEGGVASPMIIPTLLPGTNISELACPAPLAGVSVAPPALATYPSSTICPISSLALL